MLNMPNSMLTSMRSLPRVLTSLTLLAAFALTGCSSTQLTDVWRDASYTSGPMKTMLVIAVKKDQTKRRIWEDAFAEALAKKGVSAMASYRIFADAIPDTEQVRQTVLQNGYNGVLITSQVAADVRQKVVQPTTTTVPVVRYSRFYNTYYTRYRYVETPGYTETEKVFQYQTDVWEAGEGGKLIWSGVSETTDPTSPTRFSTELSGIIIPELEKARIVK